MGTELWPLTGREQELARVDSAIADGDARCLVLAGGAGVGKSRLAAESLDRAESSGAVDARRVLATRAASSIPLGAFGPVLDGELPRGAQLDDVLTAAAGLVARRPPRGRLVVLVDDAHLVDDVSAALVLHLVLEGGVFVLATVRSGEPAPDAITALWKEGLGERVDVDPLGPESVSRTLEAALGGPVDAACAQTLAARCQGNMLYLVEDVRAARQDGVLVDDRGLWRFVGPLAPSARLSELVNGRIGRLDETERRLLEAVALAEPIGTDALADIADVSQITALERRGVVSLRLSGRRSDVICAHPLFGEVVRESLSSARVRELSHGLSAAVARRGARRADDPLRQAAWQLDSGGWEDAGKMAAAAEAARDRCDLPLAARLADAAMTSGAGLRAARVAADVAVARGDVERAEQVLAAAAAAASEDGERGPLAILRIDNALWWLGDLRMARAIAAEAEQELTDPRWLHELRGRRATFGYLEGRFRETIETLTPLLDQADGPAVTVIAGQLAFALGSVGRIGEGLALMDRVRRLVAESPAATGVPAILFATSACELMLWRGDLRQVEEMLPAHYQSTLDSGSSFGRGWVARILAESALQRGDAAAAIRWATESAALLRDAPNPTMGVLAYYRLAHAHALAGHADRAQAALDDAQALPSWVKLYAGQEAIATAWVAVARGDLQAARASLLSAADATAEAPSLAVLALHDAARIGYAPDVLPAIVEAAARVEGPFAALRAAHVQALAEGDVDRLLELSGAFERLGAMLLAAEAAAAAAIRLAASGDTRRAAAARRRATLTGASVSPRTPAFAGLAAHEPLTRAEREVAMLAAGGLPSRVIAERRVTSVRTVDNTLQRAYRKLGVTSRGDLADALRHSQPPQVEQSLLT